MRAADRRSFRIQIGLASEKWSPNLLNSSSFQQYYAVFAWTLTGKAWSADDLRKCFSCGFSFYGLLANVQLKTVELFQGGDRKPQILFVEQFYYPEGWGGAQLPRDITVHLQQLGCDIQVLCGSEIYVEAGKTAAVDPRAYGVTIARIPRLAPGNPRVWRVVRHLWFYLLASGRLLFGRRPDLYIVQTNPPLIAVIAAVAARLRHRPLTIVCQDLYPEALFAAYSSRGMRALVALLEGPFSWAYRQAAAVVSLGETMTGRLLEKGVDAARVCEIPNWATGSLARDPGGEVGLADQWGTAGRKVFIYSGNMGVGHEFDTLMRALEVTAKKYPKVLVIFVGRGARVEWIAAQSSTKELQGVVQLHDFVAPNMLGESLGLADVAIVTLRPGFEGLLVPSKMLGYMARGLPVLYIGPPGDIDQLISRAQCGYAFRNDDVDGVAEFMGRVVTGELDVSAMGSSGRKYYDRFLSRERALEQYVALVARCLA